MPSHKIRPSTITNRERATWIFLGALFHERGSEPPRIEVFTTARYPLAVAGIRLRIGLPSPIATPPGGRLINHTLSH